MIAARAYARLAAFAAPLALAACASAPTPTAAGPALPVTQISYACSSSKSFSAAYQGNQVVVTIYNAAQNPWVRQVSGGAERYVDPSGKGFALVRSGDQVWIERNGQHAFANCRATGSQRLS